MLYVIYFKQHVLSSSKCRHKTIRVTVTLKVMLDMDAIFHKVAMCAVLFKSKMLKIVSTKTLNKSIFADSYDILEVNQYVTNS